MLFIIILISLIIIFYIKNIKISLKATFLISILCHSFLFLNLNPKKIDTFKKYLDNKSEKNQKEKVGETTIKTNSSPIQIQNIDFDILNMEKNIKQYQKENSILKSIEKNNENMFPKIEQKKLIRKVYSNQKQYSDSEKTSENFEKKDKSEFQNLDSTHDQNKKQNSNFKQNPSSKKTTIQENIQVKTAPSNLPKWILKKQLNQLSNFHWDNYIQQEKNISKERKWEKFDFNLNMGKKLGQEFDKINTENLENYIYKKWLFENLRKIAEKWFYKSIPLDAIFIGTLRDIQYPIQILFEIDSQEKIYDLKFLKKETILLYNDAILNVLHNFQFSKRPEGIYTKNLKLEFKLNKEINKMGNIIKINGFVHLEGLISFDK